MTDVVHVVIGPEQHGVVRHALLVADGCGHRVARYLHPSLLTRLPAADVVHLSWTDRLFGAELDDACREFDRIADLVEGIGASLSVTVHDVPHDDSPLQRRRRAGYEHVIGRARGIVVNSNVELSLVTAACDSVHSLRRIPLPVEVALPSSGTPAPHLPDRSVTVLGFVFPDRGYEDVIAALPSDASFVALGRASDGHEELPERFAMQLGDRWRLTGYLPDEQMGDALARAAVPIAPNRRVTASASINTWLAHGRRPLVPDSPYARELMRDRPGVITTYDTPDGDALSRALRRALDDPASTWLPDDCLRGPGVPAVVSDYLDHFATCVPAAATDHGGQWLVPDNRWDLIPGSNRTTTVSVVIPYFEAQQQLDLVLSALTAQSYPRELVDVCVVDDGSAQPPLLAAAGDLPARLIRQDDLGFRAARARNLGAAATAGEVLVFLDGDTVPEPDFLSELVPPVAACPDLLAVGRRRHADLSNTSRDELLELWRAGDMPTPFPEPDWLTDAYRASGDLLRADRRSYRYMISAVLAMSRSLFDELHGFDERFVGYGGEDWELAHRARTAGAVLRHVRRAVAWHDGPDWAERADSVARAADAQRQWMMLSALVPDPDARGGSGWRYPAVVVQVAAMPDMDAAALTSSALCAGVDCAFWFDEITGPAAELVSSRSGVHVGAPPPEVLARAWVQARVERPVELTDLAHLAIRADRHGQLSTSGLTLRSTRSSSRHARWSRRTSGRLPSVQALFGRHDIAPR